MPLSVHPTTRIASGLGSAGRRLHLKRPCSRLEDLPCQQRGFEPGRQRIQDAYFNCWKSCCAPYGKDKVNSFILGRAWGQNRWLLPRVGPGLVTQYVAARSPAGQAPAAATIRVPAQVSSRHRQGRHNHTGALGLTPMARPAGRNRTQTLAVMSPTPQPLGHTVVVTTCEILVGSTKRG